MVYIPLINSKLGLTNMAPMASKTWVLKQWVARSSLFFFKDKCLALINLFDNDFFLTK